MNIKKTLFICASYSLFTTCFAAATISVPDMLPEYWRTFADGLNGPVQLMTRWYDVPDEEIIERFGVNESTVNRIILCRPSGELVTESPLVLWLIHGTWAAQSPEFFDPSDETYQMFLAFGEELACRKKRPIEIVSYTWDSADSYEARRLGGTTLRFISESFFGVSSGYGPHWVVSHSHGTNVALLASQEVCFEAIVSLAAPVLEAIYSPLYVGTFYHFYSLSDFVQKLGSFDRRSAKRMLGLSGNGRFFQKESPYTTTYSFRVMFDGGEPAHLNLKRLISYFWDIVDTRESLYKHYTHFDLDISFHARAHEPFVLLSGREQLRSEDVLARMAEYGNNPEMLQELLRDFDQSKKQSELFARRYGGRSIAERSGWSAQFVANWQELSDVITRCVPFFAPR